VARDTAHLLFLSISPPKKTKVFLHQSPLPKARPNTHKDKVTVFVGSPFEEREYLKEDKNEGLFDLDCVLPMG